MTQSDPGTPVEPSAPRAPLHVVVRFLVSGALNTGATLVLYWVLLRVLHYQTAYLVSYCVGILLSYALNTRYVFKAKHSWMKFAVFPLIYLVVYAVGALTLKVAVGTLHVPAAFGPIVSIVVTLPLSFLLTRALLQRPDR